jgi:hypothetical protein
VKPPLDGPFRDAERRRDRDDRVVVQVMKDEDRPLSGLSRSNARSTISRSATSSGRDPSD